MLLCKGVLHDVRCRVLKEIEQRIKGAEEEREEKKNFTIEGLDDAPASMKVVDQPVPGITLDGQQN